MFEGGLSLILNRLLSEFIEEGCFDDNVQVAVWSGYVVLENLVLKKNFFDYLKVPLTLSHGTIGKLELRIPWSNLGREPVVIVIDQVFLLVEPKYEWDATAHGMRQQAIKQAKLAAAEMLAEQRLLGDLEQNFQSRARSWLLEGLLRKLVDKIQIHIREVHIRYEDRMSCPTDFCVGMTIESLHVQSESNNNNNATNPNEDNENSFNNNGTTPFGSIHRPKYTQSQYDSPLDINSSSAFQKLVQLNHLAVYWNPLIPSALDVCVGTFVGRPRNDIIALMSRTIAKRNHSFTERPRHHFILHPVDAQTYLTVAPPDVSKVDAPPKIHVKISLSEIQVSFEDRQFREIISLSTNLDAFSKLEHFCMYRPRVKSYSSGLDLAGMSSGDPNGHGKSITRANATEWWRYAIKAVLLQLREDKRHFHWKYMKRRRDDKFVYVELWKRKLSGTTTASSGSQMIDDDNVDDTSTLAESMPMSLNQKTSTSSSIGSDLDIDAYLSAGLGLRNPSFRKSFEYINLLKFSRNRLSDIETRTNLRNTKLGTGDADMLETLEEHLTFEDIIFFRSLAEKQLGETAPKPSNSWLGRVIGYVTGQERGKMSEESRKFIDALKEDPNSIFDIVQDKNKGDSSNTVIAEPTTFITMSIGHGCITMGLSAPEEVLRPNSYNSECVPFLEVAFDFFDIGITQYGDTQQKVDLTLHDIEVFESLPPEIGHGKRGALNVGTRYGKIVSRREVYDSHHSDTQRDLHGYDGYQTGMGLSSGSLDGPEVLSLNSIRGDEIGRLHDQGRGAASPSVLSPNVSPSRSHSNTQLYRDKDFISPDRSDYGSSPHINEYDSEHRSRQQQRNRKMMDSDYRGDPFNGSRANISTSGKKKSQTPLFVARLDLSPQGQDYDVVIKVSMEELEIFVSPAAQWINSIATFFTWPQDVEFWSEMEMAAMNQLADLRTQFEAKLEYMMHNHVNVMASVLIKAPLVVISEQGDLVGDHDMVLIDLGHISLNTKKLAKLEHELSIHERDSNSESRFSHLSTPSRFLSPATDYMNSTNRTGARHTGRQMPMQMNTVGSAVKSKPTALYTSYNVNDDDNSTDIINNASSQSTVEVGDVLDNNDEVNNSSIDVTGANDDKNNMSAQVSDGDQDRSLNLSMDGENFRNGNSNSSFAEIEMIDNDDLDERTTFFDVFQLQVSQVEVYMAQVNEDWRSFSSDAIASRSILDRFDVQVEIHVSTLIYDSTMPPFKLYLDLPELHLKLSEFKLTRLLKFGRSISLAGQRVISEHGGKMVRMANALTGRVTPSSHNNMNDLDNGDEDEDSSYDSDDNSDEDIDLSDFEDAKSFSGSFLNLSRRGSGLRSKKSTGDVGGANTSQLSGRSGRSSSSRRSSRSRRSGGTASNTNREILLRRKRLGSGSNRDSSSIASFDINANSSVADKVSMLDTLEDFHEEMEMETESIDSFETADAIPELDELKMQVEELQQTLRQRELLRAQIITDMRSIEADPTKSQLHRALKEDLASSEVELQQLKVSYVESLILLDETRVARRSAGLLDDDDYMNEDMVEGGAYSDKRKTDLTARNVLDSIMQAPPGEHTELEAAKYRRNLIRTSIFRQSQQPKDIAGPRSNREFVFALITIPVIHMEYSCPLGTHPSDEWHPLARGSKLVKADSNSGLKVDNNSRSNPEKAILRLRCTGVSLKAKHRLFDSAITFVLRELDIEDAVATEMAGGQPSYVFSTEILPTAMMQNRESYLGSSTSDLIRMKYEVVHPTSTKDKDRTSNASISSQSTIQSDIMQHYLRLNLGTIGACVDQEMVVAVHRTADRISRQLQMIDPESSRNNNSRTNGEHERNIDTRKGQMKPLPLGEKSKLNLSTNTASITRESGKRQKSSLSLNIRASGICAVLLSSPGLGGAPLSRESRRAPPTVLINISLWGLALAAYIKRRRMQISLKLTDITVTHVPITVERTGTHSRSGSGSNLLGMETERVPLEPAMSLAQKQTLILGRQPDSFGPFLSLDAIFTHNYDKQRERGKDRGVKERNRSRSGSDLATDSPNVSSHSHSSTEWRGVVKLHVVPQRVILYPSLVEAIAECIATGQLACHYRERILLSKSLKAHESEYAMYEDVEPPLTQPLQLLSWAVNGAIAMRSSVTVGAVTVVIPCHGEQASIATTGGTAYSCEESDVTFSTSGVIASLSLGCMQQSSAPLLSDLSIRIDMKDVGVSVGRMPLIKPLQICVETGISGTDTEAKNENYDPVTTSTSLTPSSSTSLPSPLPDLHAHTLSQDQIKMSGNTIDVSVTITPVEIKLNECILVCVSRWCHVWSWHLDYCDSMLNSQKVFSSIGTTSIPSASNTLKHAVGLPSLGASIYASLTIQEVSLYLGCDLGNQQNILNTSNHDMTTAVAETTLLLSRLYGTGMGRNPTSLGHTRVPKMEGLYQFCFRHIALDVSCNDNSKEFERPNMVVGTAFKAKHNSKNIDDRNATVVTSLSVKSFDVVALKQARHELQRIIATVSSTSSIFSSTSSSTTPVSPLSKSRIDKTKRSKTEDSRNTEQAEGTDTNEYRSNDNTNLLGIIMNLDTQGGLMIDVDLQNLHMVTAVTQATSLVTLLVCYDRCIRAGVELHRNKIVTDDPSSNASSRVSGSSWQMRERSGSRSYNSSALSRGDRDKSISTRKTMMHPSLEGMNEGLAHARPSSVPLSTETRSIGTVDAPAQKSIQDVTPKNLIFDKSSFRLPAFLSALRIVLNAKNMSVWLPSESNNAHARVIELSLGCHISAEHLPIDWGELQQARESFASIASDSSYEQEATSRQDYLDLQCHQQVWKTDAQLKDIQMVLSRIRYSEFFSPLQSLSQRLAEESATTMKVNTKVPQFSVNPILHRVIMRPFTIHVMHNIALVQSLTTHRSRNSNLSAVSFSVLEEPAPPSTVPLDHPSISQLCYFELEHDVAIMIPEISCFGYLDYKPFEEVVIHSVMPLMELVSTLAKSSNETDLPLGVERRTQPMIDTPSVTYTSVSEEDNDASLGAQDAINGSRMNNNVSSEPVGLQTTPPSSPSQEGSHANRILHQQLINSSSNEIGHGFGHSDMLSAVNFLEFLPFSGRVAHIQLSLKAEGIRLTVVNDVYSPSNGNSVIRLMMHSIECKLLVSSSSVLVPGEIPIYPMNGRKGNSRLEPLLPAITALDGDTFMSPWVQQNLSTLVNDYDSNLNNDSTIRSILTHMQDSKNLTVSWTKLRVGADYYNSRLMVWEPLAENFTIQITSTKQGDVSTATTRSRESNCQRMNTDDDGMRPLLVYWDMTVTEEEVDAATRGEGLNHGEASLIHDIVLSGGVRRSMQMLLTPDASKLSPIVMDIRVPDTIDLNLTVPVFDAVSIAVEAVQYAKSRSRVSDAIKPDDTTAGSGPGGAFLQNESGLHLVLWHKGIEISSNSTSSPSRISDTMHVDSAGIVEKDKKSKRRREKGRIVPPMGQVPIIQRNANATVTEGLDASNRSRAMRVSVSLIGPEFDGTNPKTIREEESNENDNALESPIHLSLSQVNPDALWPVMRGFTLEGVEGAFSRLVALEAQTDSPVKLSTLQAVRTYLTAERRDGVRDREMGRRRKRQGQLNISGHARVGGDLPSRFVLAVAEMAANRGNRCLKIRSTLRLVNSTCDTFRLSVLNVHVERGMSTTQFKTSISGADLLWSHILTPNSKVHIPVHLSHLSDGILQLTRIQANNSSPSNGGNNRDSFNQQDKLSYPSSPSNDEISTSVYFGIPELPGLSSGSASTSTASGSQLRDSVVSMGSRDDSPMNLNGEATGLANSSLPAVRYRRLVRSRDASDVLYYSHWMRFPRGRRNNVSDQASINIDVRAHGIPRQMEDGQSIFTASNKEPIALRTITIGCPFTLTNLLASDAAFLVQRKEAVRQMGLTLSAVDAAKQVVTLRPGETWSTLVFHPEEELSLFVRPVSPRLKSSSEWGHEVVIPGCDPFENDSGEVAEALTCPVEFVNSSYLDVQVEVQVLNGARSLAVFVPYWVISSTSMPLYYQHSESSVMKTSSYGDTTGRPTVSTSTKSMLSSLDFDQSNYAVNGTDELASDQSNLSPELGMTQPHGSMSGNSIDDESKNGNKLCPPRGAGLARGIGGIMLGPDVPVRGLGDALRSDQNSSGSKFSRLVRKPPKGEYAEDFATLIRGLPDDAKISHRHRSTDTTPDASSSRKDVHRIPYKLAQFGYTNAISKRLHLKLRAKGTGWSKQFKVAESTREKVIVELSSSGSGTSNASLSQRSRRWLLDHNQLFYFGVSTQTADPPFHRTKIVTVVDRLMAQNSMGQALELRQVGYDDVTTIRPGEQRALWRRPGRWKVQIRLGRFGWGWSGIFDCDPGTGSPSASVSDGTINEVPLRLRNDHDNTVFFVMAELVAFGPRICIIFRGGSSVAPYRVENHTMRTMRIRQGTTNFGAKVDATCDGPPSMVTRIKAAAVDPLAAVSAWSMKGITLPYTTLLPYHSCAYAWDEPLSDSVLTIEKLITNHSMDGEASSGEITNAANSSSNNNNGSVSHMSGGSVSGLESREMWVEIGRFTFDRFETFFGAVGGHAQNLMIKVSPRGPVRCLQIFDARTHAPPRIRPRNLPTSTTHNNVKRNDIRSNTNVSMNSNVNALNIGNLSGTDDSASTSSSVNGRNGSSTVGPSDVSFSSNNKNTNKSSGFTNVDKLESDTPNKSLSLSRRGSISRSSKHQQLTPGTSKARSLLGDLRSPSALTPKGLAAQAQNDTETMSYSLGLGLSSPTSSSVTGANSPVRPGTGVGASISSMVNGASTASTSSHTYSRSSASTLQLRVFVHIHSIGVSVMDHTPQELIYFSASNVNSEHLQYPASEMTTLTFGRIQVDSQLWSSSFPVLLYPLPSGSMSGMGYGYSQLLPDHQRTRTVPFASIKIERDFSYPGVQLFPMIQVLACPFDINIEGTLIARMAALVSHVSSKSRQLNMDTDMAMFDSDFSSALITTNTQRTGRTGVAGSVKATHASVDNLVERALAPALQLSGTVIDYNTNSLRTTRASNSSNAQASSSHSVPKLYVGRLDISGLRFNISVDPDMGSDQVPIDDEFVGNVIAAVGTTLRATIGKIDNCPLSFKPLSKSHLYSTPRALTHTILGNYAAQTFGQLYLVVGSSIALGNPVQLFTTIKEGVWDFLSMPAMGAMHSLEDFIRGLQRGSSSLARRVVASLCHAGVFMISSAQLNLLAYAPIDSPVLWAIQSEFDSTQDTEEKNTASLSLITDLSKTQMQGMSVYGHLIGLGRGFVVVVSHLWSYNTDRLEAWARPWRAATKHTRPKITNGETMNASLTPSSLVTNTNLGTASAACPDGLLAGFTTGLMGLLLEPWLGLRIDGFRGIIAGMLRGLFGAMGKPLYGFLFSSRQFLEHVSYNLLPQLKGQDKQRMKRTRPPRVMLSEREPLRAYSKDANLGQELLARISRGRYRLEGHLWHGRLRLGDNDPLTAQAQHERASATAAGMERFDKYRKAIAVVTTKRIIVVGDGDARDFCVVKWQCAMSQLLSLEVLYDYDSEQEFQSYSSKSSSVWPPLSTASLNTVVVADAHGDATLGESSSSTALALVTDSDDTDATSPITRAWNTLRTCRQVLTDRAALLSHTNLSSSHTQRVPVPVLALRYLLVDPTRRETYTRNVNGIRLGYRTIYPTSHSQALDLLQLFVVAQPKLLNSSCCNYLLACGLPAHAARPNVETLLNQQQIILPEDIGSVSSTDATSIASGSAGREVDIDIDSTSAGASIRSTCYTVLTLPFINNHGVDGGIGVVGKWANTNRSGNASINAGGSASRSGRVGDMKDIRSRAHHRTTLDKDINLVGSNNSGEGDRDERVALTVIGTATTSSTVSTGTTSDAGDPEQETEVELEHKSREGQPFTLEREAREAREDAHTETETFKDGKSDQDENDIDIDNDVDHDDMDLPG